jgi:hypothetical protein
LGGANSGPDIGDGKTTRPGPYIGRVVVGWPVNWVSADVVDVDADIGAKETMGDDEVMDKLASDISDIILNISDTGSSSLASTGLLRSRGGVVDWV